MSLQLAAKHLADKGRGPDSTLVHMSMDELRSLQDLAKAHGGAITINPDTGLPEAGFLSSILPMLAGAALTATGVGAPIAALMVGGGMTAATGSLKKGIMAGLGAYGGAGLGAGLMGAGAETLGATANAMGVPVATGAGSQTAMLAAQNQGFGQAGLEALGQSAATAPGASGFVNTPIESMTSGAMGLTEAGGREAFMRNIGGTKGLLISGGAALAPMLMGGDQQAQAPGIKPTTPTTPLQFNPGRVGPTPAPDVPGYGNQGQNFGREQRYFNPSFTPINPPAPTAPITTMPVLPGIGNMYAEGGPIEDMSISNVYDMQNARGGVSDMGIDNSTGMQRMAGGGITGNGELNLNIPLNFGGGGGGGFGGGFNQGPLDLGQNRTGFGQSAGNVYQPAGSGASSSPPGFLAPKPSSTVGLTENPFNLGTQLASRLGSANQNPFAAQPTPEMMAAQREANAFNPAGNLADLQRRVGDREQSFDEYQSRRRIPRHPGDQVPTDEAIKNDYQRYLQDRNKEMRELIRGMQQGRFAEGNMGPAPLAHVLQPGTAQYDNYMKNRGPSNQFERFADGGMARGGISHLGDYSDGGRLLRGPGDGVSDSIPAMIGRKQPARLADGEFVVPARIVSELGNGSTEAGARKLYAMMDRVQRARGKTTGKGRVAKNTRAEKYLPA